MENITYSHLPSSIFRLDIDECADDSTNDCDTNADCTNIDGGFTCECKPGWEGDGKTCTGLKKFSIIMKTLFCHNYTDMGFNTKDFYLFYWRSHHLKEEIRFNL